MLVPAVFSQDYIWQVAEHLEGHACLSQLGMDLREVRPGRNFLMLQRGIGWNYTDYFVSVSVNVHYVGEYTSEGGGRKERIDKETRLNLGFEPHSEGPFESIVSSAFRLTPRPGWELEGILIPDSAKCTIWVERPPTFSKDNRNVVLRAKH